MKILEDTTKRKKHLRNINKRRDEETSIDP